MAIYLEKDDPCLWVKKIFAILIIAGIMTGFLGFGTMRIIQAKTQVDPESSPVFELAVIQGNTLLPVSELFNPEPQPIRKIKVIVTGYSSTEEQTDSNPFITAAGTLVRDGIVATNILPFGTRIKLPEIFGNKIFVVEDRMNPRKGYHVDIWFSNYEEALHFGAKITEVLVFSD